LRNLGVRQGWSACVPNEVSERIYAGPRANISASRNHQQKEPGAILFNISIPWVFGNYINNIMREDEETRYILQNISRKRVFIYLYNSKRTSKRQIY
jgi:hypothetical protein